MNELTKRTANSWREFFSTSAAAEGLAFILDSRPIITGKTIEEAAMTGKELAGFDLFRRKIDEILNFESARNRKSTEETETDNLKQ